MKRGFFIAFGVVFLVIGVALAGLGVTVALSVGSDDALSTDAARVRGTGVAVVADAFGVDTSSVPVPAGVGTLTLTVSARDGRAVFVGAAKPSDVGTYLAGAPYDVVVDLSGGQKATTRKVPGSKKPSPPGEQTFWLASSSGAPATLDARLDPGTTLVVMNADAGAVVDADLVVTLRVPQVWTYSWIAVGVGVLLGLLGLMLLWRARVARRRHGQDGAAGSGLPAAVAGSALAATVLPDDVAPGQPVVAAPPDAGLPVVVAPDDGEAVVSAPSAALAALVADAAPPHEDVAAEIPVVPAASGDRAAAEEEDGEPDPLFAELVAAHGGDPVHDGLPAEAASVDEDALAEGAVNRGAAPGPVPTDG